MVILKDEQQLLEQYRKNGDLRLLGKLYEPYMPVLYGVCYRYFRDQERSEDAVMEIFETLVVKLRQHQVSNFKSWLYTLARNHCLMELRKAGSQTEVSLDGEDSDHLMADVTQWAGEGNFDPGMEERLTLMESCMEKLSPEQRTCVQLFYIQQKCYQDIAGETGYEMSKVKSYIQNGKRNIKICMERNANEQ